METYKYDDFLSATDSLAPPSLQPSTLRPYPDLLSLQLPPLSFACHLQLILDQTAPEARKTP